MAKTRQQNSIVSAITAVTAALRLESIPNPTPEQQQQIHDAKVKAANVIDSSNFITAGEVADDGIETMHQVDEIFDAAGIDRVALQRQQAIENAQVAVAIEQQQLPE